MRRKLGLTISRDASPEEKSAYYKKRRELLLQDPEWVANQHARHADYRARKGKELFERQRQWRDDNPERWAEIQRQSNKKHRIRLNAKQRKKNKDPKRRAYMKAYARKHRSNNVEIYRSYGKRRRALRAGADGSHTHDEWLCKIDQFDGCCVYCGDAGDLTRDHAMPLSRGGFDHIDNIVPACGSCNSRKGTMTADEFRRWLDAETPGHSDSALPRVATG